MQLALETFWSILTLELVPQQGLESFVFCFPLFTFFTDYCFEKNGVGDGIVFEPSTIARECPAQWTRVENDLGELARLRREGWTSRELQAHFGFGRTKINAELRRLRTARKSVQR